MDDRKRTETATLDERPTAIDPELASAGPSQAGSGERYRVVGRLGKGGMGDVLLVRDQRIGREIALKRIRKAAPSEALVKRFLREAMVQGRLEHPSVVPLYDVAEDEHGQPFFTMKKLTGTSLDKLIRTPGERIQRLLRAFADICLAVEYAHTRGITHRDLKPHNVLLGDFGDVYVIDWGIAKVAGEPDGEFADMSSVNDSDDNRSTLPGAQLGTPGYMAPEQVRGEPDVDARADVYSLGCILFEILTQSRRHPTGQAGLDSALEGRDVRPSERTGGREIAPELDELCVRALAADRTVRIATARELGEAIQRFLDGDRDLAVREELARAHLARARSAFAGGEDEDQRRLAMREAASALALAPTLGEAAELVGRLMLEPPRTTPREVEEALVADDVQAVKDHARVGVMIFGGFLAFTPLLWWIAPRGSPYVLALTFTLILSLGLCRWGSRQRSYGKEWMIGFANLILIAIVSHMYTPFLVAPGLAAMAALAILLTPTRARFTSSLAVMVATSCIVVIGPWVLERIGALPVTTTIGGDGVVLRAPALAGDETSTLVVGILYVIGLIAGAAMLARMVRAREHTTRRRLHLQAWQLRQLIPRG